jgi:hypothetical protein
MIYLNVKADNLRELERGSPEEKARFWVLIRDKGENDNQQFSE